MIPASRILRSDAYLVWLVFCRYAATGFGLGMGFWFAALLLGFIKRIGW